MATPSRPAPTRRPAADVRPAPGRRGPSARGVALLIAVPGLVGAVISGLVSHDLGVAFGVLFVLGCAIGAFVGAERERWTVLVAPPLVFLAAAFVAGGLSHGGAVGGWISQQYQEMLLTMIVGAPYLFMGEAVAAVVALMRGRRPIRA